MESLSAAVKTSGFALPPMAGVQVAVYVDRHPTGFHPAGAWRDRWGGNDCAVHTYGLDLLGVRLRIVVERLAPGVRTTWGLV